MTRHRLLFLTLVVAGLGCDCQGKMLITDDAGEDAQSDGDVDGSAPVCAAVNDACTAEFPCCSGLTCDPGANLCVPTMSSCGLVATTCADPGDCCSGACSSANLCATACVQNAMACQVNGDCCSGNCVGNVCMAATGSFCATLGQACGSDAACCSNNCQNDACVSAGSSCVAFGDTCYENDDCCSAKCSENGTGVGGICISLGVGGTGSCRMAGEPCGDCGACCSRTCVETATGGSACLQASGCALEGELCDTTSDCCGAVSPPGVGTMTCNRANGGDAFGRCVLSGNTPDGAVCKSATPWCEASIAPSNCGNCLAPKAQCCRIDPNGTPRCFGGSTAECPAGYDSNDPSCCIAAGDQCNFTGECCGGAPCLPDGGGVLRCGASCSATDAPCTTSSDCCLGLACVIPTGEMIGACKMPTTPPPTDGGVPDGSVPLCSQFGQACGTTQPCCDGVGCLSQGTAANCGASDTDCSCFGIIIE